MKFPVVERTGYQKSSGIFVASHSRSSAGVITRIPFAFMASIWAGH